MRRTTDSRAVFPERKLMPLKTRAFIEAMGAVLARCESTLLEKKSSSSLS